MEAARSVLAHVGLGWPALLAFSSPLRMASPLQPASPGRCRDSPAPAGEATAAVATAKPASPHARPDAARWPRAHFLLSPGKPTVRRLIAWRARRVAATGGTDGLAVPRLCAGLARAKSLRPLAQLAPVAGIGRRRAGIADPGQCRDLLLGLLGGPARVGTVILQTTGLRFPIVPRHDFTEFGSGHIDLRRCVGQDANHEWHGWG